MSDSRTIVLVGHCGPDMHLLKSAVSRAVPGVRVVTANDEATLGGLGAPSALLLVNRVLDGDFPTDSGIDLISQWHQQSNSPAMMLVSNHEDAQAEAVSAGALPGFGKSQLHLESTARRLREAIS